MIVCFCPDRKTAGPLMCRLPLLQPSALAVQAFAWAGVRVDKAFYQED